MRSPVASSSAAHNPPLVRRGSGHAQGPLSCCSTSSSSMATPPASRPRARTRARARKPAAEWDMEKRRRPGILHKELPNGSAPELQSNSPLQDSCCCPLQSRQSGLLVSWRVSQHQLTPLIGSVVWSKPMVHLPGRTKGSNHFLVLANPNQQSRVPEDN